MAITRQDISYHNQFLARQEIYERRYSRMLLNVLSKQYRQAAKEYRETGTFNLDTTEMEPVYRKLYTMCIVNEAQQAWDKWVKPLSGEQKDFIDDLSRILGINATPSELIRIWRRLAGDYMTINIMSRLENVTDTTRKAINKIIEKASNEGYGADKIAREIVSQAKGEINVNRSNLIARTETMNALNRGKRIAMLSSNLMWNHKWLATRDDRTRHPHLHMNNEPAIPLEQDFVVFGESLAYPGDPRGSAGNVILCRCTETFEVRRDVNGRPMRRM